MISIVYLVLIIFVTFLSAYAFHNHVTPNDYLSKLLNDRKGPADNDFISNFFSKILPTPEDIGLKRYDRNSRPENYPCTKTEYAELLPEDIASNDSDILLIRQLLAKTNLEFRPLQSIYDANRDGWRAKIFHDKVDKLGPAIVLARSASGGTFGGYNPCG